MERKVYKATLSLPGDEGTFTARFASIGPPPDHDSDITEAGAFQQNQRVLLEAFNHNLSELPVGEGRITSDHVEALVSGRFYLNTPQGRAHYETLKAMEQCEFSYTFNILSSRPGTWKGQKVRYLERLDVWGISMVSRGAGLNTALLSLKSARQRRGHDDILGTTVHHALSTIAVMEADLLDGEMEELQRRVDRASTGTRATNRDVVRRDIARRHPGHSPRYIDVLTEIELVALAQREALRRDIADRAASPNPGVVEAELMRWARSPARRRRH